MPKDDKENAAAAKRTQRVFESNIAQALVRPGLKTKVVPIPNSVNFRVHWYSTVKDSRTQGEYEKEVDSRFVAVHDGGDNKFTIIDRTLDAGKQKLADVEFVMQKPREPVISEKANNELPEAEPDTAEEKSEKKK